MKSLIKHLIFKLSLKIFFILGKILKRGQIQKFAKILGNILFFIPFSRKYTALNNLKIAFESYDKHQLKNLLKKFLQEVILTAVEVAYIVKKKEKLSSWATAEGLHYLNEALKKGTGVIALSGHIGNIPVMLAWLAEKGYPVAVLFKEGRYLPKGFLYNLISSYKIYPIPFRSDEEIAKEIIKALNKNLIVFILADQARKGIYAKFFGKLVQCQKGAFIIALRKASPLLPVFIVRENNRHHIKIYPPLSLRKEKTPTDEELIKYIESYNSLLENLIGQHPEQYYWFHRRFKKMKHH